MGSHSSQWFPASFNFHVTVRNFWICWESALFPFAYTTKIRNKKFPISRQRYAFRNVKMEVNAYRRMCASAEWIFMGPRVKLENFLASRFPLLRYFRWRNAKPSKNEFVTIFLSNRRDPQWLVFYSNCNITCMPGNKFPDGSTSVQLYCDGEKWVSSNEEWTTIPNCERMVPFFP